MSTEIKKPRLLLIEDNPDTRQIYKDGEKELSFAQAASAYFKLARTFRKEGPSVK